MSCLSVPRVHFFGRMLVNTPTANNNNYDMVLDAEKVALFEPYASMSDEGFRQLMKQLILKDASVFDLGFLQVLNANWDYYGDNSVLWQGVKVTGIETEDGEHLSKSAQDRLIGAEVDLRGDRRGDESTAAVIVDNDPTGNLTSQIFFTTFSVGEGGGVGFTAQSNETQRLPRTYSRLIDLTRNLSVLPDTSYSALWQLPLPFANLTFRGHDKSETLAKLEAQAGDGIGLVARFCTYYFERRFTDQEMARDFAAGKTPQNSSDGFVLGTIGAWREGELGTMMAGRRLRAPQKGKKLTVEVGGRPREYQLSPAFAEVDEQRRVVALDLATTFPEFTHLKKPVPPDPKDPLELAHELHKVELGTASLEVVKGRQVTTLGTFDYSTHNYLARGGVVEVPFRREHAAAIRDGVLRVKCEKAGKEPVLTEEVFTADTDDRAVYLTEGESTSIRVRILEKGGPPKTPVPVGVQQFRIVQSMPPTESGVDGVTRKDQFLTPQGAPPFLKIEPQGDLVGEDGILTLRLTGLEPGRGKLRFLFPDYPATPPVPGSLDMPAWLALHFCNVRVLPADNQYDDIPDDQVTWELVYDEVLRYFYRLYPTMDSFMKLNDQQAVEQRAQMVKLLTSKENWFSTLYMPITRELSDGKRRLLHRWCDRVLAGEPT